MTPPYVLHGWHLSFFSGKTRGYLNFKDIPYLDKNVNAYDLMVRIPKKTGAMVMPVVQTQQGEWLQDTSIIVNELEKRHPHNPVMPSTAKQYMAALLLEAWLDEWWIPIAMHYRWSYPENYDLFIDDASTALLPKVPNFIRRPLAKKIATGLRKFLPVAGVRAEQFAAIESWTNAILDALEIHFSDYPFLLGDRPCIADFALLGPLYGHLNRDPAPKRDLLDKRPKLQNWVERCHNGEGKNGQYLPHDQIPATLNPLFESLFTEFYPLLDSINEQLKNYIQKNQKQSGDHLARAVGEASSTMNAQPFSRGALPYTLWMMQRVHDCFQQLSPEQQLKVHQWTASFNQDHILDRDLGPTLVRFNVTTKLA